MTVPLDRANNNLGGGQAGEELDLLRLYPRVVKSVVHHPVYFLRDSLSKIYSGV
jgi:hypothetical protein